MKVTGLECPKCGANVKIPAAGKAFSCPHCNAQLFLDDEVKRVEVIHRDERRRRTVTPMRYDRYDGGYDDGGSDREERRERRSRAFRAQLNEPTENEKLRLDEERKKIRMELHSHKRKVWCTVLLIWLALVFLISLFFCWDVGFIGSVTGVFTGIVGSGLLAGHVPESFFPYDEKNEDECMILQGTLFCIALLLSVIAGICAPSPHHNNPPAQDSSLTDELTEITSSAYTEENLLP